MSRNSVKGHPYEQSITYLCATIRHTNTNYVSDCRLRVFKKSDIEKIIRTAGGVARTSDFNAAGFPNYAVSDMHNQGLIRRVRSGYYTLPNDDEREELTISQLFPDGIVCMDSALFHWGYSNRTPKVWHLAFQRTVTRSRFKDVFPPIRPYFVQDDIFDLGVTVDSFSGINLKIYDRERTICDCFKRRSQMDSETFAKAVNAYATDKEKNVSNLSSYAKKLRVYRPMTDMMEVLLNV